jgi:hypothetical protein
MASINNSPIIEDADSRKIFLAFGNTATSIARTGINNANTCRFMPNILFLIYSPREWPNGPQTQSE